jgi:hypothetical protein
MTHQQSGKPPRRELLCDVVSVLMIVVGAVGSLALAVMRVDVWLLGSEGLLMVGLCLGVRRSRAAAPERTQSDVVTIIEHGKPNNE